MLAWMIYVTAVGLGAGLAALIGEGALRRFGRPVRWVWAAAMSATVVVPLVHVFGVAGQPSQRFWAETPWSVASVLPGAVIPVAWAALSLILLSNLRLSVWTLRRNERFWRTGSLAGHRVSFSPGFGPGVIGAQHPRIVLPEWILDVAPELQRVILLHEIEHVRSGDTRLLLAAVILVSLMPWSLPLWWQLHRLRDAIETDCDGRVLQATGDAAEYGRALVSVAGMPSRAPLPVAGLGSARSELERRIRRLAARREGNISAAAIGAVAALALASGVLFLPAPRLPMQDLGSAARPPEAPTSATVILSVDPAAGQQQGE
jgi:bla regulator protein BlaR1